MAYAKYHRKEKEREKSKKRYDMGLYNRKNKKNKYKKKGYNPNSKPIKEKHWNWKGGITPLRDVIRHLFEYRQWRSDVFTRDNFTCQYCGVRGCYLEADHHIKSFAQIIEENNINTIEKAINCEELWNLNNGRTLCKDCHNLTKTRRLNKCKKI